MHMYVPVIGLIKESTHTQFELSLEAWIFIMINLSNLQASYAEGLRLYTLCFFFQGHRGAENTPWSKPKSAYVSMVKSDGLYTMA